MGFYFLAPFWPFAKIARFHVCIPTVLILLTFYWKTVSAGQPVFCMIFKLTYGKNHMYTLLQFSFLLWGWRAVDVVVFFPLLSGMGERMFSTAGSFFSGTCMSDSHTMHEINTHTHTLLNEKSCSRSQITNWQCCNLCPSS